MALPFPFAQKLQSESCEARWRLPEHQKLDRAEAALAVHSMGHFQAYTEVQSVTPMEYLSGDASMFVEAEMKSFLMGPRTGEWEQFNDCA